MIWFKKKRPFTELLEILTKDKNLVFIQNLSEANLDIFIRAYDKYTNKFETLIDIDQKTINYHWHKDSSGIWDLEQKVKSDTKNVFIYYQEDYHSNYITYPEKDDLHDYAVLLLPIGDYFRKNPISYSRNNNYYGIFNDVFKYFKSDLSRDVDNIFLVNNISTKEIKKWVEPQQGVFYLKIENKRIILNYLNKKEVFSYPE